jgi:hypothetical protein
MRSKGRSKAKCLFGAVSVVLVMSAPQAWAGGQAARVMAPWEAHGNLYEVEPGKLLYQGTFEGIMYAEGEQGIFDGANIVCPATHHIDVEAGEVEGSGQCMIETTDGDMVYGSYECGGKVGGCAGKFRIIGGTGKLEGITGSSDFRIRTVLATLARKLGTGGVITQGEGLATWASFKYCMKSGKEPQAPTEGQSPAKEPAAPAHP